jgi:hypothetical protein
MTVYPKNETGVAKMKFVPRSEWHARQPSAKNKLEKFGVDKVKCIFVTDCSTTSQCTDILECCSNMRILQKYHTTDRGTYVRSIDFLMFYVR